MKKLAWPVAGIWGANVFLVLLREYIGFLVFLSITVLVVGIIGAVIFTRRSYF